MVYCEYCKSNVRNIKSHLKSKKHMKSLIGAGLLGDIWDKGKELLNKGLDMTKGLLEKLLKYDFNNVSKDTLKKYGNLKIKSVILMRKPIDKYVNVMANLISQGALNEIKKKYGYDQFYHVAMGIALENPASQMPKGYTLVIYERVENVMIRTSQPKLWADYQKYTFMVNQPITLDEMVSKTIDAVSAKTYFSYNPITLNCQVFLKNTITYGLNMWNDKISNWLYQPIQPDDFPELAGKAMSILTDLGKIGSQIIGGGLQQTRKRQPRKTEAEFWEEQKQKANKLKQQQYANNALAKANEDDNKLMKFVDYTTRMHLGKTNQQFYNSVVQQANKLFKYATNKDEVFEFLREFVDDYLNEKHIPEPETEQEGEYIMGKIEEYDNRTSKYLDNYIKTLFDSQNGAITQQQIKSLLNLVSDLYDDDLQQEYIDQIQELAGELATRTEKLPSWLEALTNLSKTGLRAFGFGNMVDKVETAQNLATGFLGSGLSLHSVKVKKNVGFTKAKEHSENIAKRRNMMVKEMKNHYNFRVIPKTQFTPKTFRSKKVNDDITLVFGKLRKYKK